jgi:DNA mismatch endonuclease (patch repair protein)
MDKLSIEKRSWNMSQVKNQDTKPELRVRSALHRLGYRFRLHQKDLPGTPDIVLPRYKKIILVHGCFWHRHPSCKFAYMPKSNVNFWQEKFQANLVRDKNTIKALEDQGWFVVIIWECETIDLNQLTARINLIFSDPL